MLLSFTIFLAVTKTCKFMWGCVQETAVNKSPSQTKPALYFYSVALEHGPN